MTLSTTRSLAVLWGLPLVAVGIALGRALTVPGTVGDPLPTNHPPPTLAAGPARGVPVVTVFSDYECAACAMLDRSAGPQLRAWADQGRIRLELRHSPLAAHRRGRRAAAWSVCAARAGRGWAMHDALIASSAWRGPGPGEPAFLALADALGIDGRSTRTCVESGGAAESLAADTALARDGGVTAVPTVFLDGRRLEPAAPRGVLRAVARRIVPPPP